MAFHKSTAAASLGSGDDDITVCEHIADNPEAGPLVSLILRIAVRVADSATEATPWLSFTSQFLVALWFGHVMCGCVPPLRSGDDMSPLVEASV